MQDRILCEARGTGLVASLMLSLNLASGCNRAGETPTPTAHVRDSAGIAIVRHRSSQETGAPSWTVDELIAVDASTAGDSAEFGFVADVALDGDTLYVLDAFAQRVGVFGASGSLVRWIGGPGEGPGELSRFTWSLILTRDTLSVADWGRGRLHHFHPEGAFHGSTLFVGGASRSWWRRARDGEIYFRTVTRVVNDRGAWSGRDHLVRGSLDGTRTDTVFTFTYAETDIGGPGRPALPLLVNAPSWDVLADGAIVWSTLEDTRVRVHRSDASLERVIESEDWVRRAPSAADEAILLELMGDKLVSLGGSRATVEQLDARQPSALPAITSVRAGPEGTILVQRMGTVAYAHPMGLNSPDPPTAWGGPLWDVFDRLGRRVALLDLGPRVRVTRITEDRIVGVRRDELGREQVVLWSLRR